MDQSQQYVLTLLQDEPTAQAMRGVTALDEDHWREVIAAAEALGVAPLLSGRAERLQLPLPPRIRAQLRGILQTQTARNLNMLGQFNVLARALQEQGVDFMPMKGVHLCTSLYENIGERPSWDIDLLVPLGDIRQTLGVIEKAGYKASRPFDLDLEVRNYHHVPAFVKRGAPPLEIHWTLLNPRFQNGLSWQELWERSVPARVGDVDVRVFSPEDLLIYLCAHVAYQHIYIDSVRSLYDIKLLLQQQSGKLDWGAITARARTWGLANSVYLTLRLADELLVCPLPDSVWQGLRPPAFNERLVEAALRRILEHSETSPVVRAVWSRRNLPDRLEGLWGRLMVPRSVLAGRYHLRPDSWNVSWYYFVRARDLLRVHGGDLLDLLLGRRSKRDLALRESELIAYLNWWK
jgi:hypothetical protein